MEHLFDKLRQNEESGIYPYHMPGHKRRSWGKLSGELCGYDITEIDGFDNLHQPEGILKELQEEAARMYGAEESFYLVNGSTVGILTAVSCALPRGGHLLMSRNCHKSVYHAAYLRNLKISYLYPPVLEDFDIFDAVTEEQVREALDREQDIGAVLIVSPTYEGRISPIRKIAEAVHERGIPLIVDEAHGAHLGLAPGFGENSCQAGADLVIHSVHKTLPALTQTALLHVNGRLIDREYLKRFLHIYETSSPSYLLMASIDNALQYIEQDGGQAFEKFRRRFLELTERLSHCRYLRVLAPEEYAGRREAACLSENQPAIIICGRQDIGKLVISTGNASITGRQLYELLLQRYQLQPEMAAGSYVLAMFTVNDGEEAYERMARAIEEIDSQEARRREPTTPRRVSYRQPGLGSVFLPLAQAWEEPGEDVELEESPGRLAAEFVNLYPPGVPLLVPGEQITEELCGELQACLREGLTVQGIKIRKDKVLIPVLGKGNEYLHEQ